MDCSLKQLLKEYGVEEVFFEEILDMCPGLDIVDTEKVLKNLTILVNFGYPKTDIGTLIILNPKFLVYNPKIFIQKLSMISGNIEEEIKKNPYII